MLSQDSLGPRPDRRYCSGAGTAPGFTHTTKMASRTRPTSPTPRLGAPPCDWHSTRAPPAAFDMQGCICASGTLVPPHASGPVCASPRRAGSPQPQIPAVQVHARRSTSCTSACLRPLRTAELGDLSLGNKVHGWIWAVPSA